MVILRYLPKWLPSIMITLRHSYSVMVILCNGYPRHCYQIVRPHRWSYHQFYRPVLLITKWLSLAFAITHLSHDFCRPVNFLNLVTVNFIKSGLPKLGTLNRSVSDPVIQNKVCRVLRRDLNKSRLIPEIRLLKRCKTANLSRVSRQALGPDFRFAVLHRLSNRT